MHKFSKISVIGLGYIGLPTAAMFAINGVSVVGVDVNQDVVDIINKGKIHIAEPGLDKAVFEAINLKNLRATSSAEPADAFLIAVPTPFEGKNNQPDLSFIKSAIKLIAPVLAKGNLVILESTVPVGTTFSIAKLLANYRKDLTFPQSHGEDSDIRIAHCPERVLPGRVMEELKTNDRIIGGMSVKCSNDAKALYKKFVTGNCILASDPAVAEMAKLTENSFRDVNIAFANELSIVCDDLGIDVWELINLANKHPRVNILQPGPGVGGHCIAVDPWFIVSSSHKNTKLIKASREVNDRKPEWVLRKVKEKVKKMQKHLGSEANVVIACYGLSFKPDIDDIRESPAIKIANDLLMSYPRSVLLVEPNLESLPSVFNGETLIDFNEASERADIHVLLVDHQEFKNRKPNKGLIIDTRGIWS